MSQLPKGLISNILSDISLNEFGTMGLISYFGNIADEIQCTVSLSSQSAAQP